MALDVQTSSFHIVLNAQDHNKVTIKFKLPIEKLFDQLVTNFLVWVRYDMGPELRN